VIKELRQQLVSLGVWVSPSTKTTSYAKALYDCLQEAEPYTDWTAEQLREHETLARDPQFAPPLLEQDPPSQAESTTTENQHLQEESIIQQSRPEGQTSTGNILQRDQLGQSVRQQSYAKDAPKDEYQTPAQATSIIRYNQPTVPDTQTSKAIGDLLKAYNDDSKKYSGELFDILSTKLLFFYESCTRLGLEHHQYHFAYSMMLRGQATEFYYSNLFNRNFDFDTLVSKTKDYFETIENRQEYLEQWRSTTLRRTIAENPEKSKLQCLQTMLDRLHKIQRGLQEVYQLDCSMRDQVLSACQGVSECKLALFKPAATYQGVCADLRSAIGTETRFSETQQQFEADDYPTSQEPEQYWTDRTYGGGRGRFYNRGRSRGNTKFRPPSGNSRGGYNKFRSSTTRLKKCYVCEKPNCWSTRHTPEERQQAYAKFQQYAQGEASPVYFNTFLAEFEGVEGLQEQNELTETEQLLADMNIKECDDNDPPYQYLTEFGEVDGTEAVILLNNQSMLHAVTKIDVFNEPKGVPTSAFTFDSRYSGTTFQGTMPDSGAAGVSTAGLPQVTALSKLDPTILVDSSTAGNHRIKFGAGEALSLGTIQVDTQLGNITFHVLPTNTPFLFCLQDMDRMGVKLDNLQNVLIQGNKTIPVVRKWGHPWMLLHQPLEQSIAWSHLTESELRQLHRRFGHPSVQRLIKILRRAGYDTNSRAIKYLNKYCH
jgi:hypothetical protein